MWLVFAVKVVVGFFGEPIERFFKFNAFRFERSLVACSLDRYRIARNEDALAERVRYYKAIPALKSFFLETLNAMGYIGRPVLAAICMVPS